MDIFQKITDDPRIVFFALLIIGSFIRLAIHELKRVQRIQERIEKNQGKLFDEHKRINERLTELFTEHRIYYPKCQDKENERN